MGVHQVVQMQPPRFDEVEQLGKEWEASAGEGRTARRRMICQDRDRPGRYYNLVFFDSYEDAMRNSELPETNDFSQRMAALLDEPPEFFNLDGVEERDL
jgi:hypothetical protein